MMMNGRTLIIQHFTCYSTCFLFSQRNFISQTLCELKHICETNLPTYIKYSLIENTLDNSGHLKVHLDKCCFVYPPSFSFPIISYSTKRNGNSKIKQ